jgi:hypothetical protein
MSINIYKSTHCVYNNIQKRKVALRGYLTNKQTNKNYITALTAAAVTKLASSGSSPTKVTTY